jgi:hypothetical protein
MKNVLAAATALASLVLAQGAFAAPNTGSIAVSFDPPKLGSSSTTLIHVAVAQTSDAVAQINIYTGANVAVNLGAAPGTTIGSVEAVVVAHDQGGITLPAAGNVITDDPAKHASDACSPGANQAVWIMNVSVGGQTLPIPIYVNKTTGAAQALGAYNLKICLPPWDVPAGTPGRAAFGAQLTDARLTLKSIFTAPAAAGTATWSMIVTPWTPGVGTPNPAETWEARAFVPLPVVLTIKASYVKKTNTWRLSGTLTEGGKPVPRWTVRISRGRSATSLPTQASTKTSLTGAWSTAGHLTPKKTTYFQARASAPERDFTQAGCANPDTTFVPAGCKSATLPPWSVTSVVVRIKR